MITDQPLCHHAPFTRLCQLALANWQTGRTIAATAAVLAIFLKDNCPVAYPRPKQRENTQVPHLFPFHRSHLLNEAQAQG